MPSLVTLRSRKRSLINLQESHVIFRLETFICSFKIPRCCSHYDDFRYRHKCLVDRLLSQGHVALRLAKSSKKFYGRYQDLTEKYQRSVKEMVNGSFPG